MSSPNLLHGARTAGGEAVMHANQDEFETALQVQFAIPELDLVYADDDEANRYIIDQDSVSLEDVELRPGLRLNALVTAEGHVQ